MVLGAGSRAQAERACRPPGSVVTAESGINDLLDETLGPSLPAGEPPVPEKLEAHPEHAGIDPLEIIASLANLLEPAQVFQEVLRLMIRWFDADCGQIILQDRQTGRLEVVAVSSSLLKAERSFSRTILQEALRRNAPICIANAKVHPTYAKALSVSGMDSAILSVIVAPLHGADGEPAGGLYLQRRRTDRELFDATYDLDQLATVMGALSPVIIKQQQRGFLESLRLNRTKAALADLGFIVGTSRIMDTDVFEPIESYAQSDLTVCIQGETGTGKELIAQAIHALSPRAQKPFVTVRCNAIPEGLAESEFFGHVKGAFAQAFRDKPGQFEMANGGTIFLDEISKLVPQLQSKLLHVLERGTSKRIKFNRVGSVKEIAVDVRVVAASSRNLKQLADEGSLLSELFYRLNQLPLYVPPLRERKEDIIPLAKGFVERAGQERQRALRLSDRAMQALLVHDWPGNVRELSNCLRRAALLAGEGAVLGSSEIFPPDSGSWDPLGGAGSELLRQPFRRLTREQKEQVVKIAVGKYGSARKAARELGISHQTIYNSLHEA